MGTLGLNIPPTPRSSAKMYAAANKATTPNVFNSLYCEDEYNPRTGMAEEQCIVPPYQAGKDDMDADGCVLLGTYGSGSRWSCDDKLGANAEEEDVGGEPK